MRTRLSIGRQVPISIEWEGQSFNQRWYHPNRLRRVYESLSVALRLCEIQERANRVRGTVAGDLELWIPRTLDSARHFESQSTLTPDFGAVVRHNSICLAAAPLSTQREFHPESCISRGLRNRQFRADC